MNELELREGEQEMDYLLRLGSLKENGTVKVTWYDLARLLNAAFRSDQHNETESCWRKRYKRLIRHDEPKPDPSFPIRITSPIIQRDEAARERREERSATRHEDLIDRLLEATKAAEPIQHEPSFSFDDNEENAIIAMVSDIHYGLEFKSPSGEYNAEIAVKRIMDYADRLVELGHENNISVIYIALMGDMISGIIKNTIRIENRENLVEQIVGVSELITAFILQISRYFDEVFVISVNGNHSRIDQNADASLRDERLDTLVPWYCRGRLALIPNVKFDKPLDPTIAVLSLYGKKYVLVHGDMDPKLSTSVQRLESLLGYHIDYLLAGHLHVPYMSLENTGYIRNGCVCGSGDDYTVKKRLFSPASQVALIVGENGVKSIYPYVLK